jgi:DNA helicase-2/ATP-dependent DNA helicase PcrA
VIAGDAAVRGTGAPAGAQAAPQDDHARPGVLVPTPEQRAIVEWAGGPLMVLAGAGTGKTTVIVERVRWLLATQPELRPESILVLTYNVKATDELLGRFERSLGLEVARRLTVENFHGFGFRLVRTHWRELGLPADPMVLDEVGQRLLVQRLRDRIRFRLYEGWGWHQAELRDLVASIDRARDEGVTPAEYRTVAEAGLAEVAEALGRARYDDALAALDRPDGLAAAKAASARLALDDHGSVVTIARRIVRGDGREGAGGMTPDQLHAADALAARLEDQARVLGALGILEQAVAYEEYAAELGRTGAVDFGEQIRLAAHLLRERPELRWEHLARYRHVLVDEFQDANIAQIDLLELVTLAPGHVPDVAVVGDDDQSIYRFRGASYAAFDEFQARFSRRLSGDPDDLVRSVARLPLLENRRSVVPVVSAASRLIGRSVRRLKEDLHLEALRGPGPAVELVASATAQQEAEVLGERIDALRAEGTVAVLVRKRRHADALVATLRRRGIEVDVEVRPDALASPDVADIVALLRAAADPSDDIAVARVLLAGPWALGNRGFARFLRERPARGRTLLDGARLFAAGPPDAAEDGEPAATAGPMPAGRWSPSWPDPELVALRARVGAAVAAVDEVGALAREADGYRVATRAAARLRVVADLVAALGARERPVAAPHGTAAAADDATAAAVDGLVAAPDALARVRAIARFLTYVGDVAGGRRRQPLHALIRHLDDLAQVGGTLEVDPGLPPAPGAVRVMTIHQAKGLEFDVVVVPRVCAGELPDTRDESLPIPVALLRQKPEPGFEVDEERRLLYVAMTRARDRLVVSTVDALAPGRGAQRRSPFVDDLLGVDPALSAAGTLDTESVLARVPPDDVVLRDLRRTLLPAPLGLAADVAALGLADAVGAPDAAVARARDVLRLLALIDDPATAPEARAALRGDLVALLDAPPPARVGLAPPPTYADLLREKQSHSSLSEYRGCPLRFAFRYLYQLRPPQHAYLTFGSSVHEVLEADVRARIAARREGAPAQPGSMEGLAERFDHVWLDSSTGEATPVAREEYHRRARVAFERYLERESARDAQPVAVEARFDFEVPGPPDAPPIRIHGAIDRIDRHADGTIEIVDYKTGRAKTPGQVDHDDQLTMYALAVADGAVVDEATGEPIRAPGILTLFFVEHGLWISTKRTADQLDAMRTSIAETVARMRAGDFTATPSEGACGRCDYAALCPDRHVGADG